MRQSARAMIAAAALVGGLLCGAPAPPPRRRVAQVKATVVKPLILTRVQDLDLGTIVLGPGHLVGRDGRNLAQPACSAAPTPTSSAPARPGRRATMSRGTNNQRRADHRAQRDAGQPERSDQDADAGRRQSRQRHSAPIRDRPGTNFSIGGSITLDLDHRRRRPIRRHVQRHRRLLIEQPRLARPPGDSTGHG